MTLRPLLPIPPEHPGPIGLYIYPRQQISDIRKSGTDIDKAEKQWQLGFYKDRRGFQAV